MSLISITTVGERAADRLAMWGGFVDRHIGRLQADTFGDDRFHGQMDVAITGSLKVLRIAAGRHRIERTPQLIRNDDRGLVKIVMQIEGTACFEQNGRRAVLTPGEWSLYDMSQTYVVGNLDSIVQLAVLVPRDELARRVGNLDAVVARRFAGTTDTARNSRAFATNAFRQIESAGTENCDAFLDNLERAFAELDGTLSPSPGPMMRARLRGLIDTRLRDPKLSIRQIAEVAGCSKRYLHMVFDDPHQTLSAYIWRRRLEGVRHELGDVSQRHRSITDIAFAWGFNSSSHFSRSFRQHFSLSAREYRALLHDELLRTRSWPVAAPRLNLAAMAV